MSDAPCLEEIIETLTPENQAHIKRLVYGSGVQTISIASEVADLANGGNFQVALYKTPYVGDVLSPQRIVRIGVIQNSIVLPTVDSFLAQYSAIEERIEKMLNAAGALGVNVICLQEAWTCPFFFCTREKRPWCEFAEDAENGRSTQFIKRMARKHNMVIISPILERDSAHGGTIWNTAVVIGNNGNYIGKHRKNHIPRVGDFNESTYYFEGNTGHPVFETRFGKIAINICYGRHHPLNWMMFGLNGAEIVFNPCATISGLSEPMWPIEARNAAIANTYFVGGTNRVGSETYPNQFTSGDGKPAHVDFGHFYGSSYFANPDGSRTPGLSRNRDGLLVNEVDLNQIMAIRDRWAFQMTARYELYAAGLTNYVKEDFVPQTIRDPALGSVPEKASPAAEK